MCYLTRRAANVPYGANTSLSSTAAAVSVVACSRRRRGARDHSRDDGLTAPDPPSGHPARARWYTRPPAHAPRGPPRAALRACSGIAVVAAPRCRCPVTSMTALSHDAGAVLEASTLVSPPEIVRVSPGSVYRSGRSWPSAAPSGRYVACILERRRRLRNRTCRWPRPSWAAVAGRRSAIRQPGSSVSRPGHGGDLGASAVDPARFAFSPTSSTPLRSPSRRFYPLRPFAGVDGFGGLPVRPAFLPCGPVLGAPRRRGRSSPTGRTAGSPAADRRKSASSALLEVLERDAFVITSAGRLWRIVIGSGDRHATGGSLLPLRPRVGDRPLGLPRLPGARRIRCRPRPAPGVGAACAPDYRPPGSSLLGFLAPRWSAAPSSGARLGGDACGLRRLRRPRAAVRRSELGGPCGVPHRLAGHGVRPRYVPPLLTASEWWIPRLASRRGLRRVHGRRPARYRAASLSVMHVLVPGLRR